MSNQPTEHRKLAAIMFTDMVGYSALSQRNEQLALELLEEHRQLLRAVFPKHQGNEIKSTGDGFLVEFASALAAVQCAVEIQQQMRQHNEGRSAERRMLIRIGIHLGDVVRRENDVFGDGVNIAARIEPLAEPGGICVTRAVYEQIENKVDQALVQLSKPQLKNIQATVEVYRLLLDEKRAAYPVAKSSRAPMVIAGIVVLLAVIGLVAFLKSRPPAATTSPTTSSSAGTNTPPAPNVSPVLVASPSPLPVTPQLRILHSFGPTNMDGGAPFGVVTLANDGFLYGCTINPGPTGGGTLYRLRTNGEDYAVLHNFDPAKDGSGPQGVIAGRDGVLYGVTLKGGASDGGVIFRLARDGSDFRVLHHFAAEDDGRNPQNTLLEAKDGRLYGTTSTGKNKGLGQGSVFRIAKDGSGYEIVASFGQQLPNHPRQPISGLIEGTDGAFYGTSKFGGAYDKGSVYRLEASGQLTMIRSIGHTNGTSIAQPEAGLLQAGDGMLYGSTTMNGTNTDGALFHMAVDGSGFQVHWFGNRPGEARGLYTAVIEAPDGSLIGTSLSGGAANLGTVFRIGKDGNGLETLHDFRGGPTDGAHPHSPLTAGAPGVFYGAARGGGKNSVGVIFQLSIPALARPSTTTTPGAGSASH